ncbi:3-carboxy-cis,cis-muconate cycloisomerase [Streptomyces sp. NPDC059063]|uniref:3-carboxy-cis,cis-muconate cycloisomerase n=1 Tax=unclassified Streptomyces TaxID=2593676 RepID=UPI0036AA3867
MNAPDVAGVPSAAGGFDSGLLAPGRAGSAAERATGDPAFLQAMLDAEAALTRAQAAVGMAPREAAAAVSDAADAHRFDLRDLAVRARGGGNPVIPLVADLTAAVPGHAAPYVHRGATSQDVLDTATMLVAARTLDLILRDLARAEHQWARLAAAHRDTPMPGRTLTQHAAPTTFGLKAAGWRSLVLDARDRLTRVRDSLPVQLGGAVGTLAAFDAYGVLGADGPGGGGGVGHGAGGGPGVGHGPGGGAGVGLGLVAAYARELGLAEPLLPWHTLRTPVADLAAALAFTAGALGKAAVDVLTLSRTEIGEVSEGAGGGSSAMPHKANPVRATLVAAAARRAPAAAATLHASLAADDERPPGAWHAEWEPLRDLLRLTGGAARDTAELSAGLRVHARVMHEHLGLTGGLIVSEQLVARLTPVVGRARAVEVVGMLVRRVRAGDGTLGDPDTWEGLNPEERAALKELQASGDRTEPADAARWTGSAGVLTDRALERR